MSYDRVRKEVVDASALNGRAYPHEVKAMAREIQELRAQEPKCPEGQLTAERLYTAMKTCSEKPAHVRADPYVIANWWAANLLDVQPGGATILGLLVICNVQAVPNPSKSRSVLTDANGRELAEIFSSER